MSKTPANKTPAKWQRLFDHDVALAERIIIEHGQLLPQFLLHAGGGAHVVIPDFADAEAKTTSMEIVALMATAVNAEALTILTEAWIRMIERRAGESEAEHDARAYAIPASQAEDRREVVLVTLTYRVRGKRVSLSSAREIIRDATGVATGLAADDLPNGQFEGRMVNLLPAVEVPRDIQALARDALRARGVDIDALTTIQVGHA